MSNHIRSIFNKAKKKKAFGELRKIYNNLYKTSAFKAHPTKRAESIGIMEDAFKLLQEDVMRD